VPTVCLLVTTSGTSGRNAGPSPYLARSSGRLAYYGIAMGSIFVSDRSRGRQQFLRAAKRRSRAHARPLGLSVGVVGKFSQPVILHSQDDLPDERDTPSAFPSYLSKVETGALERQILENYFPCFVGTQSALPTRSHRLRRRSPSAG
jgi:hypothetical protein